MKRSKGFTLVELIVVIAILGVLTTIAVFNYLNVQRQARDDQRTSDATSLSESLEQYFAKNGEYPSIGQMTNTDGNAVKQLLGLSSLDGLVAPSASAGTTNSWRTGTPSATNPFVYTSTDTSTNCVTTPATVNPSTDACTDYKLLYYNEQNSTSIPVPSRNKTVSLNITEREGVVAPTAPTVTVAPPGTTAVATASVPTCAAGATTQLAFRTRTNDGTWGSWSAWATSTTNSITAAQGSKYGFQAKAICTLNSVNSAESAISAEATAVRAISTPAVLDVYSTSPFRPNYANVCMDAANGSSAPGTLIQIYTCNGSAAQDWARDSGAGTFSLSGARSTCIQYMGKGVQLTLQTCDGATDQQWTSNADGSYTSVASGYCIDASNWGTANGTVIGSWDCTGATAQIWNPADSSTAWTWPATSCPSGTSVEYRVNYQTTALADSGWTSAGTTPRIVRTTVNQGYTYITQAQSRCYSAYTTSAWNATNSSGIVKAVFKPGAATGWVYTAWAGRNGWGWSWDSPACGAGTNTSYIEDSWTGLNNNPNGAYLYWLSPRTPNGPGNVGWYRAESTGGASYVWYAPYSNGRGDTYVDYPSGNMRAGVDVAARTQYRCVNPVTGRSATGDWTTSVTSYT